MRGRPKHPTSLVRANAVTKLANADAGNPQRTAIVHASIHVACECGRTRRQEVAKGIGNGISDSDYIWMHASHSVTILVGGDSTRISVLTVIGTSARLQPRRALHPWLVDSHATVDLISRVGCRMLVPFAGDT